MGRSARGRKSGVIVGYPADPEDFDNYYCGDPNTIPVCNYRLYSYYDECGDPFDPENGVNWDGDQQVGFR